MTTDKLQEQEFFAARSPEIAGAQNKAARARLIKALEMAPKGSTDHVLHAAFGQNESSALIVRNTHEFADCLGLAFGVDEGGGDVNTYSLFAELFANLSRDRAGIIVPTGIATDATTANFFSSIIETRRLVRFVDFRNDRKILSKPAVLMRFALLTLASSENAEPPSFAFLLFDVAEIVDPERNFVLSPGAIAKLNPNTRTAPVFPLSCRCGTDGKDLRQRSDTN